MAKKKNKKTVDGIFVYCEHSKVEKILTLKPNPGNPNEHTEEQIDRLATVIIKNGWRNPITVSNRSGLIVKGHGRYQAAIRAGLTEAPVDFQDYETDQDEVADLIADNVIAELSRVNRDKARDLLESMKSDDIDADRFGFDIEDMNIISASGARDPGSAGGNGEAPEVEFSQELLLEHNYIVLYFDNSFDWQVAVDKFGLKKARDLIPRKAQPVGIGRVVNGADFLDRIK